MKFVFASLLLVSSLALSGCWADNSCEDTNCGHGECAEGDCVCDAGYEGVSCSIAINAKFSGKYHQTATCQDTTMQPLDSILVRPQAGSLSQFLMTGLWGLPQSTVVGEVLNDGVSFQIARQPISSTHDVASKYGTITSNGSTIILGLDVFLTGSSTVVDSCALTMQR